MIVLWEPLSLVGFCFVCPWWCWRSPEPSTCPGRCSTTDVCTPTMFVFSLFPENCSWKPLSPRPHFLSPGQSSLWVLKVTVQLLSLAIWLWSMYNTWGSSPFPLICLMVLSLVDLCNHLSLFFSRQHRKLCQIQLYTNALAKREVLP